MEGVGSRLGRASSRYGGPTSFTGPVRKWKKLWLPVSPKTSSDPATPPLLLRRWTPVVASQVDSSVIEEEPPRRKFRYTPIVDLEDQKREDTEKDDKNSKPGEDRPPTLETISQSDDLKVTPAKQFEATHMHTEHSSIDHLNLELDLFGPDQDSESEGEVEASELA